MLVLALLAVFSADQEIVVSTSPVRAADPWTQSVSAQCGSRTLVIDGYGAARPLGGAVKISVDGASVEGPDVARMAADLARPSAVYRLEMICGSNGDFVVRINRGEAGRDDAVQYDVASATIRRHEMMSYSGMETANASKFWFR